MKKPGPNLASAGQPPRASEAISPPSAINSRVAAPKHSASNARSNAAPFARGGAEMALLPGIDRLAVGPHDPGPALPDQGLHGVGQRHVVQRLRLGVAGL